MSKIFNLYTKDKNGNDIDRTWFDSSTVKYCECLDKENDLKTLKVVFNNGSQYEYKKVNVNHYLMFREDVSNGKALNKYIKGNNYEYEKLENVDISSLDKELEFRLNNGIFVIYDGETFVIKDNKDKVICEKEVKLTQQAFDTICSALEAVGKQLFIDGNNFGEYGETREDMPF